MSLFCSSFGLTSQVMEVVLEFIKGERLRVHYPKVFHCCQVYQEETVISLNAHIIYLIEMSGK